MNRIFRFIYSIYCFIPFILSFFIFIPVYFIIFNFWPKRKAPHVAHRLSRVWASVLLFFFFMRADIRNKHLIKPENTYVFVANHLSMLDILLYAISCSNTFRFLAKKELTKIPLMGYVINNLYISVNRTDKSDRHKSLDVMKATLDEGISVFLAPEGTRNKTDQLLLEFKEGAFRLAIKAQKPLAVLTVINTKQHLKTGKLLQMSPGILKAEWSEPIETAGMTENDMEHLMQLARRKMLAILES